MKEVVLHWNPATQMQFNASHASGVNVQMDAPAHNGGDAQGFSPKYMLMLALGGCTGMDVMSILRKMRQDVTGYQLDIKGWEEAELPNKFDKITVEHIVKGNNLNPENVAKAVKLSHEKYCGVSASLAGSVEIIMTYRIEQMMTEVAEPPVM